MGGDEQKINGGRSHKGSGDGKWMGEKTGEEQINQKGKNEEPKDNGEKTRKKGAKVGAWHMGLTLTGR
jgi:hypothetical protein